MYELNLNYVHYSELRMDDESDPSACSPGPFKDEQICLNPATNTMPVPRRRRQELYKPCPRALEGLRSWNPIQFGLGMYRNMTKWSKKCEHNWEIMGEIMSR